MHIERVLCSRSDSLKIRALYLQLSNPKRSLRVRDRVVKASPMLMRFHVLPTYVPGVHQLRPQPRSKDPLALADTLKTRRGHKCPNPPLPPVGACLGLHATRNTVNSIKGPRHICKPILCARRATAADKTVIGPTVVEKSAALASRPSCITTTKKLTN